MKDLEYVIQSSDIPNEVKKHIGHNENCFYYILALYKNYLIKLRDLELKKKNKQINTSKFLEQYELLKLTFAASISAKLEHFIEETKTDA